MAMGAFAMRLSVLFGITAVADADAFLRATHVDAQTVAVRTVEQTLLSELSLAGRDGHLSELQEGLRPMFEALPKNALGRLEPSVVRYALHRFFVQARGWYVQGLQPSGETWNSTSPAQIMKDRVPGFIQGLLEERVHGKGLELRELAAFAATIQDLVHAEAMQNLMDAFSMMQLPMQGRLSQGQVDSAIDAYLMGYLLNANMSGVNVSGYELLQSEILEIYPAWPDVSLWAKDLRLAMGDQLRRRQNPFEASAADFEGVAGIVQEIGHRFGSFQDQECRSMKDLLVDMEFQGTGRVRLSEFYKGTKDGNWQFAESVDYLRAMGALDESDPRMPSVVIPNYVGSQSNCLASSSFYSVCCMDECEGLMGHLESAIGAPRADPAQIARLVASLSSDTVDAPRNLSASLLQRLEEIAQHHDGEVPLHGRLFAQWMHHAYPRECPFPHASGSTKPMTPDEWMAMYGEPEASEEEMAKHLSMGENLTHMLQDDLAALPWSSLEELVAVHEQGKPSAGARSVWSALCKVVLLGAFAGMMFPIFGSSFGKLRPSDQDSKLPRYMV
jgi:hypothetical protein